MTQFSDTKILPYSASLLYDIVAGVDLYPEFLPWCLSSKIIKRQGSIFYADLEIGFKMIREKFTSQVTCAPHKINVEAVSGPFRKLINIWEFTPLSDHETKVTLFIDFEFKSFVLQKMMGMVFHEAVKEMTAAFEKRAQQLSTQS